MKDWVELRRLCTKTSHTYQTGQGCCHCRLLPLAWCCLIVGDVEGTSFPTRLCPIMFVAVFVYRLKLCMQSLVWNCHYSYPVARITYTVLVETLHAQSINQSLLIFVWWWEKESFPWQIFRTVNIRIVTLEYDLKQFHTSNKNIYPINWSSCYMTRRFIWSKVVWMQMFFMKPNLALFFYLDVSDDLSEETHVLTHQLKPPQGTGSASGVSETYSVQRMTHPCHGSFEV